jgi:hypothetical protein
MVSVIVMKITLPLLLAAEEARGGGERVLARALAECLEAMDWGETDLGKISARYPEAESEIWPLLEIAQQLSLPSDRSVPLSVEFREGLRELLLESGVV